MKNIVALADHKSQPHELVVEILERWLDDAKSGKLRSVAICGEIIDGSVVDQFCSGAGNSLLLSSAISVLAFRHTKMVVDK